MSGWIYLITNKIDSKQYIGQTIRPIAMRWKIHVDDAFRKGSCAKLANAIKKHGSNNFKVDELFYVFNDSDLDLFEIQLIEDFNTFHLGYNLTKGGGGRRGYKVSVEAKLKSSISNKGKKRSLETRKRISEARVGKKNSHGYSEEVLAKKSESMLGEKNPMFGKNLSDEHKRKLSEALKGENSPFFRLPKTEEIKDKLRKSQPHVRPVVIKGVTYDSMRLASKLLNIDRRSISRMIASGKEQTLDNPQKPL